MSVPKRFLAWLSNLGLGVALFFLATTITLLFTAANIGFIKKTLSQSGFYENFVPSTLNLVASQTPDEQQTISEFKPIIQSVATPQTVQKYTEQAIDGVGFWLKNPGSPFSISLDVKQLKSSINSQATSYVQNKINQMPSCSPSQYMQNIDILKTTCKPPIIIPQEQISQTVDNYMASLPFLKGDKLVLGKQPEPYTKNDSSTISGLPRAYKILSWSPYILAILFIVFIVLIYFLNSDKYKALRLIGHAFLATGGLLIVTGAITIVFVGGGIKQASAATSVEQVVFSNQIVIPIVKKIVSSIGTWTLYFGVAYAIVGAVSYFISHRLKIKNHPVTSEPISTNSINT